MKARPSGLWGTWIAACRSWSLQSAWAAVKDEWQDVKAATAEDWRDAKASFEQDWNEFQKKWAEATAE
jgi:hypothetical protein